MKSMRIAFVFGILAIFASVAFAERDAVFYDAIINEWIQGLGSPGSEFVEILATPQFGTTLNMQNWRIEDEAGGTKGQIVFSGAMWQSIPTGTIIVIYRSNAQTPILTAVDTDPTDDFLIILPHNNSNLTANQILGSSTSWIEFTNGTDADNPVLKNSSGLTVHEWDGGSTFTNSNVRPGGSSNQGVRYIAGSSSSSMLTTQSNWVRYSNSTTSHTAGQPNGGDNTTWIEELRNSHYPGGGFATNPNPSNQTAWTPTLPNDVGTADQPSVGITFPAQSGAFTNPSSVAVSYTAAYPPVMPISDPISRFWTITPTTENFVDAELTFNFTAAELPGGFDLANVIVSYSVDNGNSWTTLPGTYIAVDNGTYYSVTVSGLNHFSMWALGNDGLLPVELTSFTGNATESGIELRWRTESETENDYFAIDRWIEGDESTITSVTVSSLSRNGSSSTPLNYMYRDTRGLIPGAVYNYRLSDVSLSGERRLLRIITVNNTASTVTIPKGFGLVEAYPNPFNSMATIKVQLREAGSAKVAVYNLEGKLVTELYSGALGISPKLISWDASRMATGMYIVKLTSNRFSTEKKLVLMR
ncbi:MAG: T9SS type A sorting domain-containing protein [bacterium]|nr:T9SS type A sorting domain-containing protein [bacterium]